MSSRAERDENRRAMPIVAAMVDEMRALFGELSVTYACEGEIERGERWSNEGVVQPVIESRGTKVDVDAKLAAILLNPGAGKGGQQLLRHKLCAQTNVTSTGQYFVTIYPEDVERIHRYATKYADARKGGQWQRDLLRLLHAMQQQETTK